MATFVIVHGAWSGGYAWRWVRPLLVAAGHEVFTPTLTGLGERSHLATPDTDLDTHVTDVAAVLHAEDLSDVVLVGHSYGGLVITGVAGRAPGRIGRLVYLDADVPLAGECELDFVSPAERAAYEETARTSGDGWRVRPPFPDPLPPGLPPEVVWGVARMAPMPLRTMTSPARPPAPPPDLPRTYVFCTEGKDGEPPLRNLDRIRADPSWHYVELAANHIAHVTAPEKLTAALLDLVGQRSSASSSAARLAPSVSTGR
jgi:pimeloyl-ACP methyl ester carboxylesterase